MAKILVTGGAGFIGSHVAEAYLKRGDEVVILDNLSSGRRENIPAGTEFVELDIRDQKAGDLIRERRFDVVNHHAAQMDVRLSVANPRLDASINVDGLLNILEASREAGVGRILFVSSGGVIYGEPEVRPTSELAPKVPESPYGVTKLSGEQYLYYYHRIHGMEYVALRYGNVFGPRQDPHGEAGVVAIFSTRLKKGEPLTIFGDGEQTRDYIFVENVVAANMLLTSVELPRSTNLDDRGFNVGTGVGTSVNRLADILMKESGSEAEIRHAEARPGELRHSALDCSKIRQLGWDPKVGLEPGLVATYRYIAQKG
jgi:UDP-glucose 4-epimerase